ETCALRADTYQIDFVLLGVMKDLAIGLTFADDVLDLAPQVRFVRHRLLQTARGLVIDAFAAERIPRNLRLVKREWRQHVLQMQLSLIFLRNQQTQFQGLLSVIRKIKRDQHSS